MLPDQLPASDHPGGLEEHGGDAQPFEHRQTFLVIAAQAVIEADDHSEFLGGGKAARPQIGVGEEAGAAALQEGQFRGQLPGGDRRHPEAVQEGHPARLVHPVVQQTQHLAPQAPAP